MDDQIGPAEGGSQSCVRSLCAFFDVLPGGSIFENGGELIQLLSVVSVYAYHGEWAYDSWRTVIAIVRIMCSRHSALRYKGASCAGYERVIPSMSI